MTNMAAIDVSERGRPFTRAERDAMPDDGFRHELIEGTLIVSPSPGFPHQILLGRLYQTLIDHQLAGHVVMLGPFDVALGENTVVVPDLLVAPRDAFTQKELPGAPLLAVEIISPSSRTYDRVTKKALYATAGCAHYWVIDPLEPSIVAWRLEDDNYVEAGRAVGADRLAITDPLMVTLCPAELVAD